MANFPFFPDGGAPFPGTCAQCGGGRDLYVMRFDTEFGNALLCAACIRMLAEEIDYVDGKGAREVIAQLTEELHVSRETIAKIPNEVETLIDGVRSSVADFVLAISGSGDDSGSVPVQSDVNSPEAPADNLKSAAGNGKAPSKSASR